MPYEMYEDDYTNIIAIDWSIRAINNQKVLAEGSTPGIKYLCMNARDLSSFKDGSFDYVIEKSMLDAVLTGP